MSFKIIYILLVLLVLGKCITFSLLDRCACSSYSSSTDCTQNTYCSWINNACTDLTCSQVLSTYCNGSSTEYKCGWDSTQNICTTKQYACSDIKSWSECGYLDGFDCVWQTSTELCIDFTCTGVDQVNCNPFRCSYVNGKCGNPQKVDCSIQSQTSCLVTTNGYGQLCLHDELGVCSEYNIFPKDCSEYGDEPTYCAKVCTYDSENKKCNSKACGDFKTEDECFLFSDGYHLTATSCYWNQNVCQEATDANLIQYNAQNCVTKSVGHYQWDSETSKCKQCQSLTVNPLYSTLNKVITSEKNAIAIWTLISYFVFLN